MSYPPLHFRKLPTTEETSFAQLPLYTRGLGKMLLTYCDDQGRIALGKRSPADAIAWRCGADRNDRRMLVKDIQALVDIGYIRLDATHIVVVDQERDWKGIESARSSKNFGGSRPRSSRTPTTYNNVTSQNDSGSFHREEKTKEDKEREEKEKRGESEGGQAPRTDPTPTLRRQKLDEAIGKGPASWGLEGSGPALDAGNQITEGPEAQNHPTQLMARPSPPSPRQEPFVAVVEPKHVQSQIHPAKPTARAPKPKAAKPKSATLFAEPTVVLPVEHPIPKDWGPNEGHYALALEKYGFHKRHVDFLADDMRDKCEANGVLQVNWDAKFRTWMGNAWKWNGGNPPIIPPPPEPKRVCPPPPPLHPMVAEGARKAREMMEQNPNMSLRELLDFSNAGKPFSFDDAVDMVDT